MKKFKLALIVLVSLSAAQPVMAHGMKVPPAQAAAGGESGGGDDLMAWFYSWF